MNLNPSAQFSMTLIVQLVNEPGSLGQLFTELGNIGANVVALNGVSSNGVTFQQELVVNCRNVEHQSQVVQTVESMNGVGLIDSWDNTFRLHEAGKIHTVSSIQVNDLEALSMAYTPGVARVCMAIHEDESKANEYTIRKNTVAIVSDGTAVLGLGDIGAKAAMPVMEGKALLFKEFANVDAFPICLDVNSPEEVIETVVRLAPTFGGINLEDIAAPGAFEIEAALKEKLDIPVFHDDQHGTAIVALAALENALKVVGKPISDVTLVVSGLGAAGIACAKMFIQAGVKNLIGVDRQGAVYLGREDLSGAKLWLAENSNSNKISGSLSDVITGADVFVGLSGPGVLTVEDVKSMSSDPIVFAMANPTPEIQPELVTDIVGVMATGRSDYPNQINNVLAFPGVFRGALDAKATQITEKMKLVAAEAIANSIPDEELSPVNIMPSVFDKSVAARVAQAVYEEATK